MGMKEHEEKHVSKVSESPVLLKVIFPQDTLL